MEYRLRKQFCSFESEGLISVNYSIAGLVHDFFKKISQGTRFFTTVYACTKSVNKAFSTLNDILALCGLPSGFY